MEKEAEIRYSLVILISLFLHTVLIVGIMLPSFRGFMNLDIRKNYSAADESSGGRDIIVNINPDKKKVINDKTLLSEEDSSAKGYITKKKGDNWLNNSRDFALQKGSRTAGKNAKNSSMQDVNNLMTVDNSELAVSILYRQPADIFGLGGTDDFTKIPDKYSFTKDNAIYYSNDGTFSFNTAKFKPFKYFKEMKDKIAEHWYPPLLANSVMFGYTPGRVHIMAIPNQIVKLYFIMNRNGDVLNVKIVDSMGNKPLDDSCVESITKSKNFGKVPAEITGDTIIIQFGFIYIVE